MAAVNAVRGTDRLKFLPLLKSDKKMFSNGYSVLRSNE
jgi:hypothetical protein